MTFAPKRGNSGWSSWPYSSIVARFMYGLSSVPICRAKTVLVWNSKHTALKYLHFDEIFITGCTRSCQNDNFHCSQWWKFRQNDILVSVRASQEIFTRFTPSSALCSDCLIVFRVKIFWCQVCRYWWQASEPRYQRRLDRRRLDIDLTGKCLINI